VDGYYAICRVAFLIAFSERDEINLATILEGCYSINAKLQMAFNTSPYRFPLNNTYLHQNYKEKPLLLTGQLDDDLHWVLSINTLDFERIEEGCGLGRQ